MRMKTWIILDHVCFCGGRILKCVSGQGPSGGGNPLYKCSQCGKGGCAMSQTPYCWCGFEMRGHKGLAGSYRCLPLSIAKEEPMYRNLFLACGCNPDSKEAEVGIVLTRDLIELRKKLESG